VKSENTIVVAVKLEFVRGSWCWTPRW